MFRGFGFRFLSFLSSSELHNELKELLLLSGVILLLEEVYSLLLTSKLSLKDLLELLELLLIMKIVDCRLSECRID